MSDEKRMEKIISLAKRRGFIFQGSEIYGGIAGMWDYGPLGVALKNNLKQLWWNIFVDARPDIYGVDAAIIMNQEVWEASGHADGFSDPLVECVKCKKRFREDNLEKGGCPSCDGELGETRAFNMMFKTHVGALADSSTETFLRPETAQGIFVNFKNILDTFHPSLPFGIAQIGKAFRNEITARDFLFRMREFEQMEIEYFVKETEWEKHFETWRTAMNGWMQTIGLDESKIHELEVEGDDLAHYSKRTIDFEYDYPFGQSELYGLAYRTDYDLTKHAEKSGAKLEYFEQESGERFTPHVIEPSLGLDRTVLALLDSVYEEEEADGETRTVLRFAPSVAPVTTAVLPLMKKPELKEKALEIFDMLRPHIRTWYDETGSIGKRYRRQDEIGTPFAVTIDYDTLEDNAVTIRDRDTMEQERVVVKDLLSYITKQIS